MIGYKTRRRGMTLEEILTQQYFRLNNRITSDATRIRYLRAVRWLGQSLGGAATVSDLTDDNLAGLLQWLQSHLGQSAVTANGTHRCLCALWRWCRDKGLTGNPRGPTVHQIKTPARTPRAWSVPELTRLVAAADASPGSIGGMPARVWWLTLFAIALDGGVRASELLSLRWEWIDWETGWLHVPAEVRKGQHHDEAYGLRPETIAWLQRIRRPQGQILGWGDRHVSLYHARWNELLARANLPTGRHNQTQKLRRTFATLLAAAGGDATAALGHASRATTLQSYLDPTVTRKRHADVIPFHPLTVAGG